MKRLRLLTIIIILIPSCAQDIRGQTATPNVGKNIANPLNLEYDYYKQVRLEDGTAAHAYLEKGTDQDASSTGDYVWSKMIPLYASNEVKYVFEYQMDFTDSDFDALKAWLIETMGYDVKHASPDNPVWYNRDMTLTETYEYCKQHNKNITVAFLNESKKYMTLVIIDLGSRSTNTEAEMALVFTIFNE